VEEFGAGDFLVLGEGEEGGGNGAGGVDDGFEVGVVEIEDMGGDAVDHGRVEGVELFAAAEEGGFGGRDEGGEGGDGVGHGWFAGATEGTAGPVDEGADAFAANVIGKVGGPVGDYEFCQLAGDVLGGVWWGSFGRFGRGQGLGGCQRCGEEGAAVLHGLILRVGGAGGGFRTDFVPRFGKVQDERGVRQICEGDWHRAASRDRREI